MGRSEVDGRPHGGYRRGEKERASGGLSYGGAEYGEGEQKTINMRLTVLGLPTEKKKREKKIQREVTANKYGLEREQMTKKK